MKSVIETFKPVKGYEGLYEVSDYGAVRSLKYGKVKYLRNAKQRDGYERIDLCRDGKPKQYRIHRLVWEAFNGPIPDGYEIDHINTIRDDNQLSNLRVVTHKENNANPITAERHQEANSKFRNKPILQIDMVTGEVIREWECMRDVERELELRRGHISECCHGKRKSTGGYRWCFA